MRPREGGCWAAGASELRPFTFGCPCLDPRRPQAKARLRALPVDTASLRYAQRGLGKKRAAGWGEGSPPASEPPPLQLQLGLGQASPGTPVTPGRSEKSASGPLASPALGSECMGVGLQRVFPQASPCREVTGACFWPVPPPQQAALAQERWGWLGRGHPRRLGPVGVTEQPPAAPQAWGLGAHFLGEQAEARAPAPALPHCQASVRLPRVRALRRGREGPGSAQGRSPSQLRRERAPELRAQGAAGGA